MSALVVAVPALEEFVRARTAYYDPAYLSADPAFAHAHVTLLSPFVADGGLTPEVCARVADVLSGCAPFTVGFDRVEAFPDGVVHLVPEPDHEFRRLTSALVAAFPQFPPYQGQFAHTRPHVTLDRVPPGGDADAFVESVRRAVAASLPAQAYVTEARLSWYEQGACRTLARWDLGGSSDLSPAGRGPPPRRPAGGQGSTRTPAG